MIIMVNMRTIVTVIFLNVITVNCDNVNKPKESNTSGNKSMFLIPLEEIDENKLNDIEDKIRIRFEEESLGRSYESDDLSDSIGENVIGGEDKDRVIGDGETIPSGRTKGIGAWVTDSDDQSTTIYRLRYQWIYYYDFNGKVMRQVGEPDFHSVGREKFPSRITSILAPENRNDPYYFFNRRKCCRRPIRIADEDIGTCPDGWSQNEDIFGCEKEKNNTKLQSLCNDTLIDGSVIIDKKIYFFRSESYWEFDNTQNSSSPFGNCVAGPLIASEKWKGFASDNDGVFMLMNRLMMVKNKKMISWDKNGNPMFKCDIIEDKVIRRIMPRVGHPYHGIIHLGGTKYAALIENDIYYLEKTPQKFERRKVMNYLKTKEKFPPNVTASINIGNNEIVFFRFDEFCKRPVDGSRSDKLRPPQFCEWRDNREALGCSLNNTPIFVDLCEEPDINGAITLRNQIYLFRRGQYYIFDGKFVESQTGIFGAFIDGGYFTSDKWKSHDQNNDAIYVIDGRVLMFQKSRGLEGVTGETLTVTPAPTIITTKNPITVTAVSCAVISFDGDSNDEAKAKHKRLAQIINNKVYYYRYDGEEMYYDGGPEPVSESKFKFPGFVNSAFRQPTKSESGEIYYFFRGQYFCKRHLNVNSFKSETEWNALPKVTLKRNDFFPNRISIHLYFQKAQKDDNSMCIWIKNEYLFGCHKSHKNPELTDLCDNPIISNSAVINGQIQIYSDRKLHLFDSQSYTGSAFGDLLEGVIRPPVIYRGISSLKGCIFDMNNTLYNIIDRKFWSSWNGISGSPMVVKNSIKSHENFNYIPDDSSDASQPTIEPEGSIEITTPKPEVIDASTEEPSKDKSIDNTTTESPVSKDEPNDPNYNGTKYPKSGVVMLPDGQIIFVIDNMAHYYQWHAVKKTLIKGKSVHVSDSTGKLPPRITGSLSFDGETYYFFRGNRFCKRELYESSEKKEFEKIDDVEEEKSSRCLWVHNSYFFGCKRNGTNDILKSICENPFITGISYWSGKIHIWIYFQLYIFDGKSNKDSMIGEVTEGPFNANSRWKGFGSSIGGFFFYSGKLIKSLFNGRLLVWRFSGGDPELKDEMIHTNETDINFDFTKNGAIVTLPDYFVFVIGTELRYYEWNRKKEVLTKRRTIDVTDSNESLPSKITASLTIDKKMYYFFRGKTFCKRNLMTKSDKNEFKVEGEVENDQSSHCQWISNSYLFSCENKNKTIAFSNFCDESVFITGSGFWKKRIYLWVNYYLYIFDGESKKESVFGTLVNGPTDPEKRWKDFRSYTGGFFFHDDLLIRVSETGQIAFWNFKGGPPEAKEETVEEIIDNAENMAKSNLSNLEFDYSKHGGAVILPDDSFLFIINDQINYYQLIDNGWGGYKLRKDKVVAADESDEKFPTRITGSYTTDNEIYYFFRYSLFCRRTLLGEAEDEFEDAQFKEPDKSTRCIWFKNFYHFGCRRKKRSPQITEICKDPAITGAGYWNDEVYVWIKHENVYIFDGKDLMDSPIGNLLKGPFKPSERWNGFIPRLSDSFIYEGKLIMMMNGRMTYWFVSGGGTPIKKHQLIEGHSKRKPKTASGTGMRFIFYPNGGSGDFEEDNLQRSAVAYLGKDRFVIIQGYNTFYLHSDGHYFFFENKNEKGIPTDESDENFPSPIVSIIGELKDGTHIFFQKTMHCRRKLKDRSECVFMKNKKLFGCDKSKDYSGLEDLCNDMAIDDAFMIKNDIYVFRRENYWIFDHKMAESRTIGSYVKGPEDATKRWKRLQRTQHTGFFAFNGNIFLFINKTYWVWRPDGGNPIVANEPMFLESSTVMSTAKLESDDESNKRKIVYTDEAFISLCKNPVLVAADANLDGTEIYLFKEENYYVLTNLTDGVGTLFRSGETQEWLPKFESKGFRSMMTCKEGWRRGNLYEFMQGKQRFAWSPPPLYKLWGKEIWSDMPVTGFGAVLHNRDIDKPMMIGLDGDECPEWKNSAELFGCYGNGSVRNSHLIELQTLKPKPVTDSDARTDLCSDLNLSDGTVFLNGSLMLFRGQKFFEVIDFPENPQIIRAGDSESIWKGFTKNPDAVSIVNEGHIRRGYLYEFIGGNWSGWYPDGKPWVATPKWWGQPEPSHKFGAVMHDGDINNPIAIGFDQELVHYYGTDTGGWYLKEKKMTSESKELFPNNVTAAWKFNDHIYLFSNDRYCKRQMQCKDVEFRCCKEWISGAELFKCNDKTLKSSYDEIPNIESDVTTQSIVSTKKPKKHKKRRRSKKSKKSKKSKRTTIGLSGETIETTETSKSIEFVTEVSEITEVIETVPTEKTRRKGKD